MMAKKLKAMLTKADYDALTDPLRELYAPDPDDPTQFVLEGVDDQEYKKKLAEFRDTNRGLLRKTRELEEKAAKFKDVDPEKYEEAMQALARLREVEEKKLLDSGQVEEVVAKRTEMMRKESEARVNSLSAELKKIVEERDALKSRLGGLLVDSQVQNVIAKVGKVRTGALDDVMSRARSLWRADENGNLRAEKGGEPVFGKDSKPLTLEEWASNLLSDAPHLFESSGGGGAEGGGRRSAGGKKVIPNDPLSIGRYAKEIAEGSVVVAEDK